ncbi:MAG: amino acid adenylation domain-containing protein [Gammaproteobacteria bacterium]|nr:amino acid adenylation domain-containing protein [Gammaproteobacteria bacterium]
MNLPSQNDQRNALVRKLLDAVPEQSPVLAPIQSRLPGTVVPLSFSQERFWFLDRLAPGNPFYVESIAMQLPPCAVEFALLEQAINIVVGRHEVLRTRFVDQGAGAVQIVMPELYVPLQITDLSAMGVNERRAETTRLLQDNASLPFDLSQPPLIRFLLIRGTAKGEIFAMAVHHIVSDGWSMRILSQEINEAAKTLTSGRFPAPPPLSIQYADFAVWQRNRVASEDDPAMNFWRRQLVDLSELALPLDRPRPRMLDFRGAHLDRAVPANVSAGARVLAAREGATLFMVALAAFATVLGRHTGQVDIVIGTPVAGRSRAEVEPLIGLFLNTVVLRIDLSGDPTFRELLGRVRNTAIAAFDRQDTPFERIVEALEPERDLSRNPLFQVLFQLFTPHDQTVRGPKEQMETIAVDKGASILDLSVHLWVEQKGIRGRLEYSTELFDETTIERLFHHFSRFLGNAVAAPSHPLSRIEMLSEAELAAELATAQGQQVAPDVAATLPEAFAQCIDADPHALALIEGSRQVSYTELDDRMQRIAAALAAMGVGRGDRVVVCLERSVDAVAAMLAAMRLGAAYVPIDCGYPQERIRLTIADCDAKVVVTITQFLEKIGVAESLLLDESPLSSGPLPTLELSPHDLAYLVYTSGTTGRPKGVMGTHQATMNRFAWMLRAFPFAEGEVCCLKTAIAFVDSVWEIFGPLLAGVPSVILGEEEARDMSVLNARLSEHKVSRLLVVPSLLRAILDAGLDLETGLPQLIQVFTSGEKLAADLLEQVARAAPTLQVINLYGSSEVAGDATSSGHLTTPRNGAQVPIGRPLDNCQSYVLDRHLRPVPRGALGQLYVGGANLARGYFRQPGMTAERFVPNPFSIEPGARLFSTGDLVRLGADGELYFEGRADHQVKIRGHRVELAEIEMMLQGHPKIAEAIVTLSEDDAGGRLDAWVTTADGAVAQANSLRRFLSEHLPAYMIPSSFSVLEVFPLLPNGKLNRRALKDSRPVQTAATITPPQTDTEIAMAELWSELLGQPTIGTQENFFDIGGHSLLATRLITAIRDRFDIELPLTSVFLLPTLGEFAGKIEQLLLAEIEGLSEADFQSLLNDNEDLRGIRP